MAPTEEQKKLMEENKRKALEKRALANLARQGATSGPSNSVPVQSNHVIRPSFQSPNPRSATPSYNNNNDISNVRPSYSKPQFTSPAAGFYGKNKTPSGPNQNRAVASFQLITRNKFTVEAPFDNEMIDIFKKCPGAAYNPTNRKWTFPLAEHSKMLGLLNPLMTKYQFQPLPNYVLDVFKNSPAERTIPEIDISGIDPKLHSALMPFQRQSVYFGVHLDGRILIADDMGLGKTLQALALAHYYLNDWPLLIVTPSSMKYSWEEAVRQWLPSVPLHHIQVLGSGKDYIDKDCAVTISSYDLLTRKVKELEKINYKIIIFDESHLVKTQKSKRAISAMAVSAKSKRLILLSGTPALSRPEELFSQLQILKTKTFTGFHNFGVRYCDGKQTAFGWSYQGATNMAELQLILEEKYLIRRLKSQVLGQLPAKQRQMVVLDPNSVTCNTSSMKTMASQMGENQFAKAMEKRGCLLSYYAETAKAKSKAVCDYIGDLLDGGKKFLCFAHHHNLIMDVCQCIEKKNVNYIKIDGSVPPEDRKKFCDDFQVKDNVRVAVLSITAANTGLTLTSAHLVVFAELFWNPGVLTQAEDRAHRIGQQDSVVVQYLVAKCTADDYLWPLVQSKLDILSKAGLSKDNFHEANTTHLSNTKKNQSSIMDFLEDMSEEDLASVLEAEQSAVAAQPEPKRFKSI